MEHMEEDPEEDLEEDLNGHSPQNSLRKHIFISYALMAQSMSKFWDQMTALYLDFFSYGFIMNRPRIFKVHKENIRITKANYYK